MLLADAASTTSASACRTQRYVMIEHGKRSQRWVSFGIPYVKFMLKLGQQWYISDGCDATSKGLKLLN